VEIAGREEELGLSGFNLLLTKWIFKSMLLKRTYTKEAFMEMVSKSRFKTCRIQEGKVGLEVWLEK
jgi:hypothetical protein